MTGLIRGYHRPSDLGEALDLLSREGAVPLGGGTIINAGGTSVSEVVDLQDLGLGTITVDGTQLTIGATATLRDVAEHPETPPTIAHLAQAELPNTLRNAATVGGTIASGDAESGLLAGLLAFGADVTIAAQSGQSVRPLGDLLADLPPPGIITGVAIDTAGRGAFSGTGRTPADTPIVLVAGCRRADGTVTLAATGVARTPIVLDDVPLDPPGDFRGSADYRIHLCEVHRVRVLAKLEGDQS